MSKPMRAALYVRVSTNEQTTDNQIRDLQTAATQRGWELTRTYSDEGISGAKGRDRRPGLDSMLKDAARRRFDVVMVWTVDRLGRSLPDLVSSMQDLHAARVDLFILQQGLDTTTPSGRAMFGMLGVFAEFERAMIQSRILSGIARARAQGKHIGRKPIPEAKVAAIKARLSQGVGMLRVARELGVGSGTVQRVKREMSEAVPAN